MAAASEIKVSVNGADNKKIDNSKKRSPLSGRRTASAKESKKKNIASVGGPKKPAPKKEAKTKGKLLGFLATAAIATLVAGGGIYIWQQSVNEKTVDKLSGQAREAKLGFEDRIDKLKRKLTGTETKNIELKQKAKELEERVVLLNKAKIDYLNEELSVSFTYPAVFGEIEVKTKAIASSSLVAGKFKDNDKLEFGGASLDYKLQGSSTKPKIEELQGFIKKRRDYFLVGPGGVKYEVKPIEIIETKSGEAILIDARSFVLDGEEKEAPINIGQNAAIIVNLDNNKYPGLSFVDSDFGMLPRQSFITMIETFEVIK